MRRCVLLAVAVGLALAATDPQPASAAVSKSSKSGGFQITLPDPWFVDFWKDGKSYVLFTALHGTEKDQVANIWFAASSPGSKGYKDLELYLKESGIPQTLKKFSKDRPYRIVSQRDGPEAVLGSGERAKTIEIAMALEEEGEPYRFLFAHLTHGGLWYYFFVFNKRRAPLEPYLPTIFEGIRLIQPLPLVN